MTAATFPQAIIERAMLVEDGMKSLAQIIPDAMPALAALIDQFRTVVGMAIQGGGGGMGMGMGQQQPMGGMGGPMIPPAQPMQGAAGAPPMM